MASRTISYKDLRLDIAYIKHSPKQNFHIESGADSSVTSVLDSSNALDSSDNTAHNNHRTNAQKANTQKINNSKIIVFLHGWGSNKELMHLAFSKSFADYTHYYIDLPGFGASPYGEAHTSPTLPILDTHDYAQIIMAFFASLSITPSILVGHSFGGKVAMLCPQIETILLSSAGIVCKKPLSVRFKILCAKFAKKLHIKLPYLRAKDAQTLNPTMYEIFKRVVDEDFSHIFSSSTKKVNIFWGINDEATPLDSGKTIHALIPQSQFFALEGDHYFFLRQASLIESLYHKHTSHKQSHAHLPHEQTPHIQTYHIIVSGVVQGVGYRKFTKARADELGISGSVENLPNGSVEIFAHTSDETLARFIQELEKGPARSQVEKVESNTLDSTMRTKNAHTKGIQTYSTPSCASTESTTGFHIITSHTITS